MRPILFLPRPCLISFHPADPIGSHGKEKCLVLGMRDLGLSPALKLIIHVTFAISPKLSESHFPGLSCSNQNCFSIG